MIENFSVRLRFKGQALVEFALVLPLFLLVVIAIFEFSYLMKNFLALNYAAGRAAKEATKLRNVADANVKIIRAVLENASGLDNLKIKVIGGDGNEYGPFKLSGSKILDGNNSEVTSFPDVFVWSDNGTPGNRSDDVLTDFSNSNASYVVVRLKYEHEMLVPYPDFMYFKNFNIFVRAEYDLLPAE